MNEDSGFSGTQLFFAFLGGAAAGAVVALLTAPQSGADTRAQLREVAANSRERARRVPEALKNAAGAASDAFTHALEVSNHG